MENVRVRHGLGAWVTKKNELAGVKTILNSKSPVLTRSQGYVDLQMFWETFGKPTCFTFGAGERKVAHKPNEYIDLKKLEKGEKFWTAFLKKFCSVQ